MESYMTFIFSTMTCSNTFAVFAPKTDPTTLSTIMKRIHINGGHGLKNPDGMITPKGVVTKVTDEELQLLEGMLGFRQQVAAGFLVVDKKNTDAEKKAANMSQHDKSAPLTPKDFEMGKDSSEDALIYSNKSRKANYS